MWWYCLSTKLSTGNSCGSAEALERSRGDLSGPTTALGQLCTLLIHLLPLVKEEIAGERQVERFSQLAERDLAGVPNFPVG